MTTYVDNTNGGVDVDIDDETKAKWLLTQGYISTKTKSKAKDADERGIYATSEPAKGDPTLAENREAPVPVDKIKPHVANDGTGEDERETLVGRDMGLGAEPVAPTGPAVKVKSDKDAGKAS